MKRFQILALLASAACCTAVEAAPVPPQAPTDQFAWAITDHPAAKPDQPVSGKPVIVLENARKVVVKQSVASAGAWGNSGNGATVVSVRAGRATPVRNFVFRGGRAGGRRGMGGSCGSGG